MAGPNPSDVSGNAENIHESSSSAGSSSSYSQSVLKYLRSIDANLEAFVKQGPHNFSQANARDRQSEDRTFRNKYNNGGVPFGKNPFRKGRGNKFTDGLEQALLDNILGPDFNRNLRDIQKRFAKEFGVSIDDLPNELGKQLGDLALNAFSKTDFGRSLKGSLDKLKQSLVDAAASGFSEKSGGGLDDIADMIRNIFNSGQGDAADAASSVGRQAKNAAGGVVDDAINAVTGKAASGIDDALGPIIGTLGSGATNASAALNGLLGAASKVAPQLIAIQLALFALDKILESFGPAIEGAKKLWDKVNNAMNRGLSSSQKRTELEIERFTKDINAMIEEPFDILKDAAQKIYTVFDNYVRTINATQGYSKSDLQDLMANYAERIRSEDLTKVIGGTDIIESLSKILETGLSGAVAEEFAYQATVLNAAIPTQDFFSYAETYASLAANLIAQGADEATAIAYANKQLELFASNVLYASRQISGGFSTGLKNASELFTDAVQIAQASKSGNPAEIAGVLTAVAAATGAVAPDLATSMTDAIVKAALGGNSSDIVALRSLAGVNASNTEFLRQLAEDPQRIFSTLFSNLSNLQHMSEDAYMEVAEGLSSVFGISMDAFARIDFNYLADSIRNMNVSTDALNENMDLLASGETTTTAEQLRMQQINEYMIEEGLAYVLDNEVARSIQENMWAEQRAMEMMEATYGVELKGAALELLEGIKQTVGNILSVINPLSWIRKIVDGITTVAESNAMSADIVQLLELGKVGTGNAQSLYQLTTRGVDLHLTPDMVSLMGGVSRYGTASTVRRALTSVIEPYFALHELFGGIGSALGALQYGGSREVSSRYSWGTVSKSAYSAISGSYVPDRYLSTSSGSSGSGNYTTTSTTAASNKLLEQNFARFTDEEYIQELIGEGKDYYDWVATASRFGISNYEDALDKLGYTEEDMMSHFDAQSTAAYQQEELQRREMEETFWTNTSQYQLEIKDNTYTMIDLLTVNNEYLLSISNKLAEFYQAWTDYYITGVLFAEKFSDSEIDQIRSAEQSESSKAIYALADILTNGDDKLLDPVLQTNALLAQILLVVQSIMNQNSTPGSLSIADTLQALATGSFNLSSTPAGNGTIT